MIRIDHHDALGYVIEGELQLPRLLTPIHAVAVHCARPMRGRMIAMRDCVCVMNRRT
jgi:hypothetical protein